MVDVYSINDEPISGYRLLRRLAWEAFGSSWLACGPQGETVCVRIIGLVNRSVQHDFRPLRRLHALRHPHLLPILGLWLKDQRGRSLDLEVLDDDAFAGNPALDLILVTELKGSPLRLRLQTAQSQGGKGIPLVELLEYVGGIGAGLDFLHGNETSSGVDSRGIVFGDITPDNLLLTDGKASLPDLSKARLTQGRRNAAAMTGAGYLAPECASAGEFGPASDQYALAVSYVEMRTGAMPLDTESSFGAILTHLRGALDLGRVPPSEREVLARALSVRPENRFPTCSDFVRSLKETSGHKVLVQVGAGQSCDVVAGSAGATTRAANPSTDDSTVDLERPLRLNRIAGSTRLSAVNDVVGTSLGLHQDRIHGGPISGGHPFRSVSATIGMNPPIPRTSGDGKVAASDPSDSTSELVGPDSQLGSEFDPDSVDLGASPSDSDDEAGISQILSKTSLPAPDEFSPSASGISGVESSTPTGLPSTEVVVNLKIVEVSRASNGEMDWGDRAAKKLGDSSSSVGKRSAPPLSPETDTDRSRRTDPDLPPIALRERLLSHHDETDPYISQPGGQEAGDNWSASPKVPPPTGTVKPKETATVPITPARNRKRRLPLLWLMPIAVTLGLLIAWLAKNHGRFFTSESDNDGEKQMVGILDGSSNGSNHNDSASRSSSSSSAASSPSAASSSSSKREDGSKPRIERKQFSIEPVAVGTDKLSFSLKGKEGRFSTLEDAVSTATDGDVVLIGGSGRVFLKPIHLHKKNLTIKADANARPVLEPIANLPDWEALFVSHASTLRVEGITLRSQAASSSRSSLPTRLVSCEGGSLKLTDCTLRADRGSSLVFCSDPEKIHIENCSFQADSLSVCVELNESADCEVRLVGNTMKLDNLDRAALSIWSGETRKKAGLRVILERNDWTAGKIASFSGIPDDIVLRTVGNHFSFQHTFLGVTGFPFHDSWRKVTTWEDEGNTYSGGEWRVKAEGWGIKMEDPGSR